MKSFYRVLLLLTTGLLLFCESRLNADSLPLENGRIRGWEVIVMDLTERQKSQIKDYKPYMTLVLTKKQKSQISKKTNLKTMPTKVTIAKPDDTKGNCTCGLCNFGLLFDKGKIEVPVGYLMSDEDCKKHSTFD